MIETPEPPARKPRKGDEIVVRVEALDARGRGIAKHGESRIALAHALPGAQVRAKVLRRRRDAVEGVALETLQKSPDEVVARCEHFGSCGGCSFQDFAYTAQLAALRELVRGALCAKHLLANIDVEPVVPAPHEYRYRNKMEFTFGNRRWIHPSEPQNAPDGFALGLHAKNLHSKVLDVRACAIQDEEADAIVASVREIALRERLEPWDLRSHTGFLRHLVLRVSGTTAEILVTLVTSRDEPALVDAFAAQLVARHPRVTTFVHAVNSRAGATAIGESERVVFGPGFIREIVDGVTFRVSSRSFFQTNSLQAARLFEIVREECALSGRESVWDLYCGTGTLSLVLARHAREVIGFEIVVEANDDARANAAANGITNARFEAGDVLALTEESRRLEAPDVIVVDPPRAGLHPKVAPRLAELPARRLIYVSCNPSAAANDVAIFVERGWKLARVRPIDLFPHTPHVETVLTLERLP